MRRYYITDRHGCRDVLHCIERAAQGGVGLIQIREKDLAARELLLLVRRAVEIARPWPARILVNERVDVALAAGAHGVHLPSGSVAPRTWRDLLGPEFLIGVSCHSVEELRAAESASFAVFGPVFPSPGKAKAVGIGALAAAVQSSPVPVFALGGVDESNAQDCVKAGASGIAAIRLFQR